MIYIQVFLYLLLFPLHQSNTKLLHYSNEKKTNTRTTTNKQQKEKKERREMSGILGRKSLLRYIIIFFSSISLQFISGLASDPSSSKDGTKADNHAASSSSTGLRVVFICLGLVAAVLLSVFLFRKWQKKKREEQHARLLRLFEEDDELELELGLRD